ncbi:MAG: BNR-4 repeat-containing protein [Luteolibacter sp.]
MSRSFHFVTGLVAALFLQANAADTPSDPGTPVVTIAPDGAWTWFNDERAIIHQGSILCGYVREDGHYGVTRYDPGSGKSHHSVISTEESRQKDDHNNPSLTPLSDGKILALYSRHSRGRKLYQRTSLHPLPSSDADWGPEIALPLPAANTYANTYRLSEESNAIYNFSRCINYNPTLIRSRDEGKSWETPISLIRTGDGKVRPYVRYVSNDKDRIDLIYTDGHPRNVENSVYHLSYHGNAFHKSDGSPLKKIPELPLDHDTGERGSVIYQYSDKPWSGQQGPDDWIPTGRAWVWDIHYGKDGHPVCVFQVQIGDPGTWSTTSRIYYYYARWTGSAWQKRFIAQAGRSIYAKETDYGGGMCLDPDDPRVVYISTNAAKPFALEEIENVPLAPNSRYEIWRGVTHDGGLSFEWTPVTTNSSEDNLRPIVPKHHGRTECLLWFAGSYSTFSDYSTRILGRIGPEK